MGVLSRLRDDPGAFEPGEVVEFSYPAYYRITRGDSAMVQLEAQRQARTHRLIGQIVLVDGPIVEVIWEDGRRVPYSIPVKPGQGQVPFYTSTEVLIR